MDNNVTLNADFLRKVAADAKVKQAENKETLKEKCASVIVATVGLNEIKKSMIVRR